MCLKKFLLFGLLAVVIPAFAEEAADRKTATSLNYVEHELDTRQDKFGANPNKAMEYTNAAGTVQKRTVTSDLDNGGTDSLPMVGGVNNKLDLKQDDIAAVNDHTAVTYTGQPGNIGQKGIYQATESFAEQSDNLIDAKTFNAALKNGLDSEFKCSDNRQPGTGTCWLWEIHNGMQEPYVSAIGTVTQDGIPTPANPIEPMFYHQGNMILRKLDNTYKDSYNSETSKITRMVGVKVLDGTENCSMISSGNYATNPYFSIYNSVPDMYVTTNTNQKLFCNILTSGNISGDTIAKIQVVYNGHGFLLQPSNGISTVPEFKLYLAEQYAAGTPVTVYYPLATPVEEDWTESTYSSDVYIPQNQ